MSSSKLLFLGALLLGGLASAQTIGSLADLQTSLPVPAARSAPDVLPMEVTLVGIYVSRKHAQAQFSTGNGSMFYGVGDVMQGGWEVVEITPNDVTVMKCTARKKCVRKKYAYLGK